ncbi:MAG: c-type cytochrome [Xanthomonadales bacterium]|nr:c-type cytochrome [Xanthomonadales bacterium]
MSRYPEFIALICVALAGNALAENHKKPAGHYGYGKPATAEEIAGWDIDVRPDGLGLPPGSGSVEDGEMLYETHCAVCHGSFGEGVGRYPVLAGGEDTLMEDRPEKTVGSYWPYVSTLWDYIYRAMPFTAPQSLTHDETYAISAYVLYLNDLVDDDFVMTQDNMASIELPNQPNFFGPDPRPDVQNTRCMKDCKDVSKITILSEPQPTEPEAEAVVEVASAAGAMAAAEQTYKSYCSVCHAQAIAGAPALEPADWESRIAQGKDVMVRHAIEGFQGDAGVMPPKGGFVQLSDDEVSAAVDYMLQQVQQP